MAEAFIRRRIQDLVKALNAKDIESVMTLFAPNLVSFDIVPPLRYVGADKNVEPGKKPSLHILAPSPTRYTS